MWVKHLVKQIMWITYNTTPIITHKRIKNAHDIAHNVDSANQHKKNVHNTGQNVDNMPYP